MRALKVTAAAILLVSLPLVAQEAARPSLVSDVGIRPDDSPLVRAVKIAVASRLATPSRTIDNATVGSSRVIFTTTSATVEIPTSRSMYPGGQPGAIPAPPPIAAQPDRAALEKRARELKAENERMHAEAEEPYGGDISEDQVDQRMQQIPRDIDQVQPQLNPTPQASPTSLANPTPQAKPPAGEP